MIQVEIWSDVVCPFCYIGKKRFESALESFEGKDSVEIVWKSYQLDPETKNENAQSAIDYMIERKGLTRDAVEDMFKHVEKMASEEGLNYDLKKTIPANTFNAHRLIQLAKSKGVGDLTEEKLFSAHFIEFKDVNEIGVLKKVGEEVGLTAEEVELALGDKAYGEKVMADIYEARQVGVQGVPFFVFNQKYGVSGAQPTSVFLEVLTKLRDE